MEIHGKFAKFIKGTGYFIIFKPLNIGIILLRTVI
jgi:hypothetical protein